MSPAPAEAGVDSFFSGFSATTASVVSSITVVILVDAVFAIATRSIGMPI